MKRLYHLKILFWTSILLIIIGVSCKTSKKKKNNTQTSRNTLIADSVYTHVKAAEFAFTTFDARISVTAILEGKQQSFNANLRMHTDSIMWISVSPFLGIELFRAVVDKDSVKAINRLNNTYYLSDLSFLNNIFKTNISFDMLQALIIGNELVNHTRDYTYQQSNNKHCFNFANRHKINANKHRFNHIFEADLNTFKISKHRFWDNDNTYNLEAQYSNFKESGQLFGHDLKINIATDKEQFEISIKFNNINIDKNLSYPFSIPDKYTKMP